MDEFVAQMLREVDGKRGDFGTMPIRTEPEALAQIMRVHPVTLEALSVQDSELRGVVERALTMERAA
ncbi:MAG: hypothetical protein JWL76_2120 [Thermoleophilia bacterium]|nr:hypothetical protein [Thermoleophilia bacterium]